RQAGKIETWPFFEADNFILIRKCEGMNRHVLQISGVCFKQRYRPRCRLERMNMASTSGEHSNGYANVGTNVENNAIGRQGNASNRLFVCPPVRVLAMGQQR